MSPIPSILVNGEALTEKDDADGHDRRGADPGPDCVHEADLEFTHGLGPIMKGDAVCAEHGDVDHKGVKPAVTPMKLVARTSKVIAKLR